MNFQNVSNRATLEAPPIHKMVILSSRNVSEGKNAIHDDYILRAEDEHPDFIHAFQAFSPAGDVTGDLV